MPARPTEKIRLTAKAFAFVTRNLTQLALLTGAHERTIQRWAETDEWHEALDAVGYTGERDFDRDVQPYRDIARDAGEIVKHAETLYLQARADGKTEKQAVTVACNALNIKDRRRVNRWRERFNWEATHESE